MTQGRVDNIWNDMVRTDRTANQSYETQTAQIASV